MKIPFINSFIIASFLLLSCGQSHETSETQMTDTSSITKADTTSAKTYAISLVNNKKDPSCGMPVSAGISDTAHYEKWVIGFCSTECKNEFLKNPKANIAAAEIQ